MAESWPKKRMPLYEIVGIFRDFLAHKFNSINLHILCLFQRNAFFSVDFMSKKNPQKLQKRPYLCLQLLPNCSHQKSFTHFSIFSLEIFYMASLFNSAVNYLLRFLNFDLGAFLAKLIKKNIGYETFLVTEIG